jgi:hypothetical protein
MAKSKNQNVGKVNWNIFAKSEAIKTIAGIEVQPIVVKEKPDLKAKLQVQIKFPKDSEPKLLNLPQTVHSVYPIILQKHPKIIMHGQLNRENGDCDYIIAMKEERASVGVKNVASNVFGFHIFSIAGQMKRMIGTTGQYSNYVRKDIQENLNPRELFKRPDYEKDQAFLSSWVDKDVKRMVIQTTIFSVLFSFFGLFFGVLNLIGYLEFSYYFLIPFFMMAFFMLQQRYEAKYRKRTKVFSYFWKLISFKGL